jgi:MYXO-CTERM domain-containing protein
MKFFWKWVLAASALAVPGLGLAQSLHSANWVFGTRCRVSWNPMSTTARPTPGTNPNIAAGEGVATFSDPLTGRMLLYTDGITAWNGSDVRISTSPLGGNPSSIHSGVIVPVPASPGRYYVFGNSPSAGTGAISYTVFDMRSDPGTQVGSPAVIPGSAVTNETLVAIPHANRRDYWLISTSTSAVVVIPVTSAGVGAAMLMGPTVASGAWNGLAAAPNGREFAVFTAPTVRRYPFDPATGVVGTPTLIAIAGSSSAYGAAYSSDSTKLYLTDDIGGAGDTPGRMYQVDLSPGTPVVTVLGQAAGTYVGALALGLDGRIYGACINNTAEGFHHLSVVDNPNAAGMASNYTRLGLRLASGCTAQLGLPTQVSAFNTVIEDSDRDGVEDGTDVDADNDGILDVDELSAAGGVDLSRDLDLDGVPDFRDPTAVTCVDTTPLDGFCDAIPRAYDTDGDGFANHLDLDADGDGVFDIEESGNGALDGNADGRPDTAADGDRDGLAAAFDRNDMDRAMAASNAVLRNSDATVPAGEGAADTVPDFLDTDDDGDGIPTRVERTLEGTSPGDMDMVAAFLDRDADGDTVPDAVERGVDGMVPTNSDMGGMSDRPDFLDLDSDNDCVPDRDPREAGAARTNPALPAAMADSHCAFPTPVCNRATGECSAEADTDMDGLPDRVERAIGTDPMNPDTDGDGIRDGAEVGVGPRYETRDSDMDGTIDARDNDDDGDGVPTRTELGPGGAGMPRNSDAMVTTGAGSSDAVPDYLDTDDDGDGIPTREELGAGGGAMPRNSDASVPTGEGTGDTNPDYLDGDDDGDGIPTAVERALEGMTAGDMDGLPAHIDRDADGDSVPDAVERGADGAMPVNTDMGGMTDRADFLDPDSDNDCLPDSDPREAGAARTDATRPTVDANGNCAAPTPICTRATGTCSADVDTDGDGVPDMVEGRLGTDPMNADTDRDGVRDGDEIGPGPTFTPRDTDGDGTIDARDDDDDGDGIPTSDELGAGGGAMPRNSDATVPSGEGTGDTLPDYLDPDDDGDGIPTRVERTLEGMTPGDMDTLPAHLDRDSDGDSVPDATERGADGMMPANSDGMIVGDRPDFLDGDSDNDCLPDSDPREAGAARTNPSLPSAMASANCPGQGATCDPMRGVCVPGMALDAGLPDASAPDASAPDASLDAPATIDVGTLDGGLPPSIVIYRGGGCGCAVPSGESAPAGALSLLALCALAASRRRARR